MCLYAAKAQTDTDSYIITMNDGSQFRCKLLEVKKGDHINVLREDGTTASIDWDSFRDYQKDMPVAKTKAEAPDKRESEEANDENGKTEVRSAKQIERLKRKHAKWNSCFVISARGDTIRGRIKNRGDYSLNNGSIFAESKIVCSLADESEQKFKADEFKELYIDSEESEYRKYITVEDPNSFAGANSKKLYRVITDGKCRLLFDMTVNSSGPMMGAGGMMVGGGTSTIERYFVYYKDKLTKVRTEYGFAISANFRKKCREIFNECPDLVAKIENKTFRSSDLREIVTEFNQCIGGNGNTANTRY